MQSELPADEILKVDKRGRVHVSKERRDALLDEFERCGVSAAQFAAQVGMNYQTFANWRQKRQRQRDIEAGSFAALSTMAAGNPSSPRWVEAVIDGNGTNGKTTQRPIMITLPGGARMEVSERAQVALVADLLQILEGRERRGC